MNKILSILILICGLSNIDATAQKADNAILNTLENALSKYDASLLTQQEILKFTLKEKTFFNEIVVTDIKESELASDYYINGKNLVMTNNIFNYSVFNDHVLYHSIADAEATLTKNIYATNTQKIVSNKIYLDSFSIAGIKEIEKNKIELSYSFSIPPSKMNSVPIISTHLLVIDKEKKEILSLSIETDDQESEITKRTFEFIDRKLIEKDNLNNKIRTVFDQDLEKAIGYLTDQQVKIINYTKN